MKSFRHELEDLNNPVVEQDILDLEKKIFAFKNGTLHEEKFRSLRLARGIYGQRQPGVQMIRIKIPFGKLSSKQLLRIADVSDKYSTGRLHTTTRQDIQIHYVSLDKTPELWTELEKDEITLREACGNTVRNITASPFAGIDPKEPFNVEPYAKAFFEYFLRNPVGQELGRKIKIAFSSSEEDQNFALIHDFGFIPKLKIENGKQIRGFKVLIGGGLGAQPYLAQTAYEFLETDKIIPFTESVIRVFDRYGERLRRQKARLKFLLDEFGLEQLLARAEQERITLPFPNYLIDDDSVLSDGDEERSSGRSSGREEKKGAAAGGSKWKIVAGEKKRLWERLNGKTAPLVNDLDIDAYDVWLRANVKEQKQKGLFSISIRLQTGDFYTWQARGLAALVKNYADDDIRITINQGIVVRNVRPENLPYLFSELQQLKLVLPGAGNTIDITTCPGTDTCNLGITSSYGITKELEKVIAEEYPELIFESDIKIKISGCMNSCGQHAIASIGFHGSTLKSGDRVAPALQVLLGGIASGNGEGKIAEKVIKVPARRGPDVLRKLLDDYELNGFANEYFHSYFERKGKIYFYDLLKPLAESENLKDLDFIDWGHEETYKQAIGVGECAGVAIDLVATILFEAEEKIDQARLALKNNKFSDSIYHSYSSFITGAKAVLIDRGVKTNTQSGIIADYDQLLSEETEIEKNTFSEEVFQINRNEPSFEFAKQYFDQARAFYEKISLIRKKEKSNVD